MSIYQKLSCDLTDSEIQNYSNELARVTSEQAEIEAEKKEVLSDFTAKLNKCVADSRVLARKVTTRKEERQVECDYEYDYAKGLVFVVRTDTGVTISQRKLTDDERQERLDFDKEEDKAAEQEEAASEVAKPEDPEEEHEISICGNTGCHYHDATEGNGCKQNEYVWECKQAVQEGAEVVVPAECVRCHESTKCEKCCETCEDQCNASQICLLKEAEEEKKQAQESKRDATCHEWRDCQYVDRCFTPENMEAGECLKDIEAAKPVDVPAFTFQGLMGWEYNRNEAKILAAGFRLVKYDCGSKVCQITKEDPRAGWEVLKTHETFAAAKRELDKILEDKNFISISLNTKGTVAGNNKSLTSAGFEFYRSEGIMAGHGTPRIKSFSKGWGTVNKYKTSEEVSAAWEELLSTDPKALED